MRILTVPLDLLLPPRLPMREEMDPEAFRELVSDIRARGLLQPLVVSPEGDRFRLVAGYRRWRACQEAGLLDAPCSVQSMSELEKLTAMVRENLHREDAPPLDAGKVYAALIEEHGLSVEEVAQLIGKSAAYVNTRLRALRLPDDVRDALKTGRINLTVALELGRVLTDADREFLLHHAISGGATADLVRRWVIDVNLRRQTTPPAEAPAGAIIVHTPEPVMMALCEWHRGAVPLEKTLSFRVCGDCYTFLLQVRDQVQRDEQARPREEPHVAGV